MRKLFFLCLFFVSCASNKRHLYSDCVPVGVIDSAKKDVSACLPYRP